MALTLLVDAAAWRDHLARATASRPGLVPVVKGNGYGFGRARLVAECQRLGLPEVAVGTVHELADTAAAPTRVVLTPCATADEVGLLGTAVPTVARPRDLEVLAGAGHHGPVLVKLATSMRRYGATTDELAALVRFVHGQGREVHAFAVHFPLASTSAQHTAELGLWLPRLPANCTVHVSHIDPKDLALLSSLAAGRRLRPRVGTALWHGDKAGLRLVADVVDVRRVTAGTTVGYRQVPVPTDGHVVLVTAGTAHGVHPLADGRSPFHFARTRLALLEPPHMHTSMLHVPLDDPCPEPGDRVDVQRPLTQTWVDAVIER